MSFDTAAGAPTTDDPAVPRPLDVVTAIRRRRMHRQFEDRPVPREVLQRLAWGATRAQQARSDVRHLIVVDDPHLMATARHVLPGFVNNAPSMIVHCTDLLRAQKVLGRRGVDHTTRLDAGAACAHLALLAQALGLGTCTVTSWTEPAVRTLLDLPAHIRPDVTVAVGYVPAQPSPAARGFKAGLHYNGYRAGQ